MYSKRLCIVRILPGKATVEVWRGTEKPYEIEEVYTHVKLLVLIRKMDSNPLEAYKRSRDKAPILPGEEQRSFWIA